MTKHDLTYQVVSKNRSVNRLLNYLKKTKNDVYAALHNNIHVVGKNDVLSVSAIDIETVILNQDLDETKDGIELSIRNILLSTINDFDDKYPGSATVGLLTFIHALELVIKKIPYNANIDTKCINSAIKDMSAISRVATLQEGKTILGKFVKNQALSDIILTSCELSGHNGQIFIDKIGQDQTVIEKYLGHRLPISAPPEFWYGLSKEKWSRNRVKCIVVDGIIEKISEIHHVLSALSESKDPAVLFCRGYSEEVIATLALNNKKGFLDLIPIKVQYDLEGANMLKDIAVICGTDITSSLKGELISSIELSDIPFVSSVSCSPSGVIIQNKDSVNRVYVHIANLTQEKENCSSKEKSDVIEKRIKILSSTCTKISLKQQSKEIYPIAINKIGKGIKLFSTICRSGIIKTKDINLQDLNVDNENMHVLKSVISDLQGAGLNMLPAVSFLYGLRGGYHAASAISTIGAYMVIDK